MWESCRDAKGTLRERPLGAPKAIACDGRSPAVGDRYQTAQRYRLKPSFSRQQTKVFDLLNLAPPKLGAGGLNRTVLKANRPNKGLSFVCECCGYKLHADLIGARNISLRALLIRQDWIGTGILSASLDVSNEETKAEILQRFSELG